MNLDYVTIKRYKSENLHGFILAESKKLLALQYVYDFIIDGILILDKRYVYDVESSKSNEYQLKMMQHFGLTNAIKPVNYDIKNWRNFFESALSQQPFCMIEDEFTGFDMAYIGKLEKVKKRHVVMHQFSAAGNWDKDKTKIYYDWISLCHLQSNYVNLYEKYFNLNKE